MKTIYSFWLLLLFFSLNTNLTAQNMALDFTASNDNVNTTVQNSLNMYGSDFTIEVWVKSSTPREGDQAFVSYRNGTAWRAGNYQLTGKSGEIKFSICNVTATYYLLDWADDVWHHVAATYNNTTIVTQLYIDGILVKTDNNSVKIEDQNEQLYLGGLPEGVNDQNADVQMDEIRIWKEVRTQAEIRANMHSELTGNESNLALYYNCNATSGTTLTDNSGNGITGTLNNMTDADWIPSPAFVGPKNCLAFDGIDDYAQNTGIAGATGASKFTYEALIYRDPSTGTGTDFFTKIGAGSGGAAARVILGYGSALISYYKGVESGTGVFVGPGADYPLALGKWYHIALVYDNKTLRFYIDGESVSYHTGLPQTFLLQSSYNIYLAGPEEDANIKMDEVRLWSDIRTATEIKDNMYKELVGDEAGLLAYYKMNFNNGTTIPNYSSQGTTNNATLYNMNAATDWVKSEAYNNWLNTNSTAWGTAANWATGTVPSSSTNVIIDDLSSDPVITTDIDIHNLSVESGVSLSTTGSVDISGFAELNADLTILSSKYMEVGGDLSIGSGKKLTLNSGASLITLGEVSGTADINRDMSDGSWHFVSSPIPNATANIFYGDYLQYYDEPNSTYYQIEDEFTDLNVMQGYSWRDGPSKGSFTFTGTPNTGDLNIITSSNQTNGWNLMGNPYPSSLDWNILDDTYGTIHYWNGSSDATYNDGASTNGGTRYVPPMQGFFISVPTAGTFAVSNAARVHNGATEFFKSDLSNYVKLHAINGRITDEMVIQFDTDYEEAYEYLHDAAKLLSGNSEIAHLYSINNNNELFAIDRRQECNSIDLGFTCGTNGVYEIGIVETNDINSLVLEDLKTDTKHDLLKNGNYSFSYVTEEIAERFILHFNITGITEVNANTQIFAHHKTIYIRSTNELKNAQMELIDMSGRVVFESRLLDGKNEAIATQVDAGIYLVNVFSETETHVEKVILK